MLHKMKKIYQLTLLSLLILTGSGAFSQKPFSEGILVYNVEIQSGGAGSNVGTATNTVYLKGNSSRTDMVSSLGKEITIFNSKTDNAVILKEFSGQKLMITLNKENWKAKNRQ